MLYRPNIIAHTARRLLHRTGRLLSDQNQQNAEKVAKKYVGKIRTEETKKEKHPSPISPRTREKLSKMDKQAEQHDIQSKA